MMTYNGDLMTTDGHYDRSRGRRWKVDWDTTQPIQFKLACLRGVNNTIPGGHYVLLVSLYNRLFILRGEVPSSDRSIHASRLSLSINCGV